jgi:aminoglycoside 6-adenylyltransferase
MRSEKEILDQIKNWGNKEEDIRVVLLTGSRGNPNTIVDLVSDYDIEIVVKNSEAWLNNEKWLSEFGEILAVLRTDDGFSMRMVIYKDYIRIDFRIYSVENFKQYIEQTELQEHWDSGYKILFDKDGITSKFKQPTYKAFIITKPDKEKFSEIVTEFWWDITYVAKSLWRDELFYAKYMLDNIIRFSYLQTIIEWYAGMRSNWQITTNKHGRFFKHFLDPETLLELEKTYAGSGLEENWKSIFATSRLFRRLATIIANELDYSYPRKLDEEITAYLKKLKCLERSGTTIN